MCGRIKQFSKDVSVGDRMNFTTAAGVTNGVFGVTVLKGPPLYNAQVEHLSTTWKAYTKNRGILTVDGFYEKDTFFKYKDGSQLMIPVIFNDDYDFIIITRSAKSPVIGIHRRQPMIISDTDRWINDKFFTSPTGELEREQKDAA